MPIRLPLLYLHCSCTLGTAEQEPPFRPTRHSNSLQQYMPVSHHNKTFATLLASTAGGVGAHRFYLYGIKDIWGWIHLASVPLSALFRLLVPGQPLLFVAAPLAISVLTGFIEALVIGLTTDEKWDVEYNVASGRSSASSWPLALVLVLTLGIGAVALIAAIARTFDLLFTGGAYG